MTELRISYFRPSKCRPCTVPPRAHAPSAPFPPPLHSATSFVFDISLRQTQKTLIVCVKNLLKCSSNASFILVYYQTMTYVYRWSGPPTEYNESGQTTSLSLATTCSRERPSGITWSASQTWYTASTHSSLYSWRTSAMQYTVWKLCTSRPFHVASCHVSGVAGDVGWVEGVSVWSLPGRLQFPPDTVVCGVHWWRAPGAEFRQSCMQAGSAYASTCVPHTVKAAVAIFPRCIAVWREKFAVLFVISVFAIYVEFMFTFLA